MRDDVESVVHHQPARLVAEDAVHAGDGLHEAVALHRLVGIHRVQAGRIEAGQPHVAHGHDAERGFGVLEPVRQLAAVWSGFFQRGKRDAPFAEAVSEAFGLAAGGDVGEADFVGEGGD